MRTLLAIVIGLVLVAAVGGLAGRRGPESRPRALTVFVAIWFVLCGVGTVLGVRAGYSFLHELLIHLLIFLVPAAAAFLLARRNAAHPGE